MKTTNRLSLRGYAATILILSCTGGLPDGALAAEKLVPVIRGPWIQIAGNPDLGQYTKPGQEPVDFAVWQAADGTWQAWSCIRKTLCGGKTRLFHRWEGQQLTQPNWKPMGMAMEADPSLGETEGGLQAPHVVRVGDAFHLFYGDWNNICHATSKDGKIFKRVIQPSGKTAMFSEGMGANTRDIMMIKIGSLWHGYYTAFPNSQGAVYLRTTTDFNRWSDSTVVAFGGITGTGGVSAECPHVVEKDGWFYLFRTQRYGPQNITSVYRSADPKMFGINQDDRYLVTRMAIAAPEIVQHNGQDYIVALNLHLDGLRLAKLGWEPAPEVGEPVFALGDASHRAQWKVESGNLEAPLTKSTRTLFNPPQEYFVGTAELADRKFDDARTGVIRSPEFTVTEGRYFAYVSGGSDMARLYVSMVDAETGKELNRIHSLAQANPLEPQLVPVEGAIGRRVFLRIVDQATEPWGHINFGGLHRVKR